MGAGLAAGPCRPVLGATARASRAAPHTLVVSAGGRLHTTTTLEARACCVSMSDGSGLDGRALRYGACVLLLPVPVLVPCRVLMPV